MHNDRPPAGLISYEELRKKRHKNDKMEARSENFGVFPGGELFTADDSLRMFVDPDHTRVDGWREEEEEVGATGAQGAAVGAGTCFCGEGASRDGSAV